MVEPRASQRVKWTGNGIAWPPRLTLRMQFRQLREYAFLSRTARHCHHFVRAVAATVPSLALGCGRIPSPVQGPILAREDIRARNAQHRDLQGR